MPQCGGSNRHLKEEQGRYSVRFRGKGGQDHRMVITEPRLARLVSELQELPGQHHFCYEDESSDTHEIGTADVNDWLKEVSGGDYTAKQCRTWRASVLCTRELAGKASPAPRPNRRTGTSALSADERRVFAILNLCR